jgi:hypothetical protein
MSQERQTEKQHIPRQKWTGLPRSGQLRLEARFPTTSSGACSLPRSVFRVLPCRNGQAQSIDDRRSGLWVQEWKVTAALPCQGSISSTSTQLSTSLISHLTFHYAFNLRPLAIRLHVHTSPYLTQLACPATTPTTTRIAPPLSIPGQPG